MKMSQKAIAALWIAEGGSHERADEWSAIAMAESGGDTKAGNSCCHGIAQLNVEVGVASMKCALNPVCATQKSISLSHNGEDWTPWEAYTNDSYRQFLGHSGQKLSKAEADSIAKKATEGHGILSGPADAITGAVSSLNPLSGLDQLAAAVESIARLIENLFTAHFWVRFGKGLLGAVLLLYALQGIFKATLGLEIPMGNIAKAMK